MAEQRSNEKRILDDIRQFHENVVTYKPKNQAEEKVLDLAKRYCSDTDYFLKKQDYVTAFGCINYAHGLLDALRKIDLRG